MNEWVLYYRKKYLKECLEEALKKFESAINSGDIERFREAKKNLAKIQTLCKEEGL